MGNRAIITNREKKVAVYLHWNGGRDSVEAFLEYCRIRGYSSGEYGIARFVQTVSNYFGGGSWIGVLPYTGDRKMAAYGSDNGVYVVDNWEIVDRVYPYEPFGEQSICNRTEMLRAIEDAQPEHVRLGKVLEAEEIDAKDLEVGDTVFVYWFNGYYESKVIGFGDDRVCNGTNVKGLPMTDMCGQDNIDAYIRTEKVMAIKA